MKPKTIIFFFDDDKDDKNYKKIKKKKEYFDFNVLIGTKIYLAHNSSGY
jgi:hypothetical protein